MVGSSPLVSFGTILTGVAKQLGLETRLVEVRIQQQWAALVGEPIGSHTWPVQIRFHKLYLLVENSVWLQQLTFLKPALLARLNAEAGPEFLTDIVHRPLSRTRYLRLLNIPLRHKQNWRNSQHTPLPSRTLESGAGLQR
jgi:hypothetical protein